MCVGRQVWVVQEGPFPGNRESDKKVHCCSGKVLIITDGTKLTLCLAETWEAKNVNYQKYPCNRMQDTQNKLHSSDSNLALIIDRSK
jgi:hypothetical protein